eukprot:TRINITY_DN14468_c0_g1_i2.p1 TRINITY_DN14468_c0_g1~~TRINITY_DN14468_c0_g1_i2.p1  ORF type:complete len:149 (-),score=36.69 TRINITY_DN14468_c0_g1_i2:470-853(-)
MSRLASALFLFIALLCAFAYSSEDVSNEDDAVDDEAVAETSDEEARDMIKDLDTNKDGAASLEELLASIEVESGEEQDEKEKKLLVARIQKHFPLADGDKNGQLDVSEWKVFIKAFLSDLENEDAEL